MISGVNTITELNAKGNSTNVASSLHSINQTLHLEITTSRLATTTNKLRNITTSALNLGASTFVSTLAIQNSRIQSIRFEQLGHMLLVHSHHLLTIEYVA